MGYVEFFESDAAENSMILSGKKFMGKSVSIQGSQASKILSESKESEVLPLAICVRHLDSNVTEEDVEELFSLIGELKSVKIPRNPETGEPLKYAIVHFKTPYHILNALTAANGLLFAGRQIIVDTITEFGDDIDTLTLRDSVSNLPILKANNDETSQTTYSIPNQTPSVTPLPPEASPCMILRNLFDPESEETRDPLFDVNLKDDVLNEASKFGIVTHAHVEKFGNGLVYLKFLNSEDAVKAYQGMNNRWFGGQQLSIVFVPESLYNSKFANLL
eukprot:TRINITY_DN4055_c0_g1_i1.p1 TRINITY_DN4055_c0_g1~~TRINITY_DN4055_c0_g1_i1.p1  ORF type:complete len:275 (-),score=37.83 TRINITY_DN4055_c0_g1_i1:84-908(-)